MISSMHHAKKILTKLVGLFLDTLEEGRKFK